MKKIKESIRDFADNNPTIIAIIIISAIIYFAYWFTTTPVGEAIYRQGPDLWIKENEQA